MSDREKKEIKKVLDFSPPNPVSCFEIPEQKKDQLEEGFN
jgi:hypothetical protein